MKTILMEDMNWPDIKQAIEEGYTTVVVGVGSTEQHGLYLPLKTDAIIGDEIAFRVAQKLGSALLGPTIRVGCSEHHLAFSGTVSLQSSTLKAVVKDYVESLQIHGFETIVFLPSHGGNFAPVKEAIEEIEEKYAGCRILHYTDLMGYVKVQHDTAKEFGIGPYEGGAHAGEIETSMILALESDLVIKDRFTPGYLGPLGEEQVKIILEKGMPELTDIGVLGDPSKAKAEKGETYLEKMADFLAAEMKKQMDS